MIKKLLVLAIGALTSLSASAGYTRYDFGNDPSSNVWGYFVQRDETKAIAFYSITVRAQNLNEHFGASGEFSNVYTAYNNHSTPGPTGFGVFDIFSEMYLETFNFNFESDTLAYVASYDRVIDQHYYNPDYTYFLRREVGMRGVVTKSAVDPLFAAELDTGEGHYDGIREISPTIRVPEPATLGLLGLGALGIFGARRRKNHG